MVLHVIKWDVHPDKLEDYAAWAKTAVPRTLAVPGLVEFRGFRPVTGSSQVVTTYEFADFEAWSSWYTNEEIQNLMNERRKFTFNEISELWGPSPVVPDPIRP
jgi:antibiotic biosynthesis monooxygenase (ABM) superfamily enzyme